MANEMTPKRERATWIRWDKARMCNVTSHPYVWTVTEPDGYVRTFDTRAEADAWIADYRAEVDYAAQDETVRLFEPAPAQMPGQTTF